MYERITSSQLKEILARLLGESVWLSIHTDTVKVNTWYEEFEFISFLNGKFQLGHMKFDDANAYQNVCVREDEIADIQRNVVVSPESEHIVLDMIDMCTRLCIEYNY